MLNIPETKAIMALGLKQAKLRKQVKVLAWLLGGAWVVIGLLAIKIFP
ncbi:hypothetical protein M7775_17205 [Sporomusa sphaeroides DSM 2875]|nr:hypothetical protein [Sporomusa sphaeroides]MCM0760294.1 hypothetical protein [Sporomusa sphaeroides DSM 2875]